MNLFYILIPSTVDKRYVEIVANDLLEEFGGYTLLTDQAVGAWKSPIDGKVYHDVNAVFLVATYYRSTILTLKQKWLALTGEQEIFIASVPCEIL